MPGLTFSPRVVGRERPDFYSLETFLQFPAFAGKSGEELALALYNFLTSTTDGTYHFWPMSEIAGQPRIRRVVFDSLSILNAYGFAICGQTAASLFAIYNAAGMRARQYGVPGHSLCEVFYEGHWHALDVDMWTWFRNREGQIASAYELARDAEALIVASTNKSNPCNLPDRTLKDYAEMFAQTPVCGDRVRDVQPHWLNRQRTMDFRLRPGESMTRSQTHQGRFHMPDAWKESIDKYKTEWKGHPRERYEPFRTFGNGTWTYEPDLRSTSRHVEIGAWEREGVTQNANGVCGPGHITFRIQSPYPFCGIPDWSGAKIVAKDGVWVETRGSGGITVEINDAEGAWHRVDSGGKSDVTQLMTSRYDCLIRVTLEAKATLTHFKFHGYTMTAPMSIPRLVEGANPMQVRSLDKHHLCTEPWSELIDFREAADVGAQTVRVENGGKQIFVKGWQELAPKDKAKPVSAVFKFPAPSNRSFAWIYALTSVREGPPDQPRRSALLEWSSDGETWAALGGAAIPNTALQWDSSIDGEIFVPTPVKNVFLRVTSGTAITALEFHGHLDGGVPENEQLQIVHRWVEGGGEKSFTPPLNAREYAVHCGKNPRDHTIEMRSL
jgi:hypothetical protein